MKLKLIENNPVAYVELDESDREGLLKLEKMQPGAKKVLEDYIPHIFVRGVVLKLDEEKVVALKTAYENAGIKNDGFFKNILERFRGPDVK